MEEQVNRLGGLMRDVVAVQHDVLARSNVLARVRMRPAVRRSFVTRAAMRLPRLRFAVPAFAAMGAVALWWGLLQPAPLSVAIGAANTAMERPGAVGDRLVAPAQGGLPLRFSDGSQVGLNQGARVQIAALDGRGAILQLENGRVDVSVHHRQNTHWQLRAGEFEVTVTGTRFSLDWENQSGTLNLVMTEGTVEVRGGNLSGGSPVTVTAGQRFHATSRESHWTLASAVEPSVVPQIVAAPQLDTQAEETMTAPPREDPAAPAAMRAGANNAATTLRTWQSLARAGRYDDALEMAERSGFNRACRKLGAEDLVQLGDAARLARSPARAEQAYQAARRRFPKMDRPAFALGLVAFEQRRDFRTAAHWFEIYVKQYPNGSLALEAAGREMESWHRAGDAGRARRAARAYVAQAPAGPYARLARQIAAP
jgi:transmembrane sensor